MSKKFILIFVFSAVFLFNFSFVDIAQAQVNLNREQINFLIKLLQNILHQQNQSIEGSSSKKSPEVVKDRPVDKVEKSLSEEIVKKEKESACRAFKLKLRFGDKGSDVAFLHQALIKEGLLSSNSEFGKEEIGERYFGEFTAAAVTGFQEKYRDEVLIPLGLRYGTGFVGNGTLTKLNSLYGCKEIIKDVPKTEITKKEMEAGYIKVISPAKEDKWQASSTYQIKWLAPDSLTGKNTVDISLIYAEPECFKASSPCLMPSMAPVVIANDIPNSGLYNWTISSEIVPGKAKIKIQDSKTSVSGISDYFVITLPGANQSPIIIDVSGPTNLEVGQSGSWVIRAYDPDGNLLRYKIDWGDNRVDSSQFSTKANGAVYEAVFNHAYALAGLYTTHFNVIDATGASSYKTLFFKAGSVSLGLPSLYLKTDKTIYSPTDILKLYLKRTDGSQDRLLIDIYAWRVVEESNKVLIRSNLSVSPETTEYIKLLERDLFGKSGQYSLLVCATGCNVTAGDYSRNRVTFEVLSVSPDFSITVLSPNGGETLARGYPYNIQWKTYGIPSTQIVTIVLYDVFNAPHVLTSETLNDGSEKIIVPIETPPGKAKIMISANYNNQSFSDSSDDYFNIVSQ